MSIRWTSYVWENATSLQSTELLVLLSIADHSGDNGRSFPSVARLAVRARCDQRTVFRILAHLESGGWLERQQRPGRSTVYQLLTPDTGVTPDKLSPPPTPDTDVTPPLTPVSPPPDMGVTHNHQGTTNEPAEAGGDQQGEVPQPRGTAQQQPFPRFAQARLGKAGVRQAQAWTEAWNAITSIEGAVWDPLLHLTKYLAQCEDRQRTPTPSDWQKWYAEDETKAKADAKAQRAPLVSTSNPYWE